MRPNFSGKLANLLWISTLLLGLSGCATPPPKDDPDAVAEFEQLNDPLEPMNREIFDVNTWLQDNALTPVALAYRNGVPHFARDRISDLLSNLKAPSTFANDLLQGNLSRAGVVVARFLLNSTFGVAGIMDVATPLGVPGHSADFGETLGVWGFNEGFYLVAPLYGPSSLRDGVGLVAESYADPLNYYLNDKHMRWVSQTKNLVSGASLFETYMDQLEEVRRTSLDYYSAMRSLYRQRREAQIKNAIAGSLIAESLYNLH